MQQTLRLKKLIVFKTLQDSFSKEKQAFTEVLIAQIYNHYIQNFFQNIEYLVEKDIHT